MDPTLMWSADAELSLLSAAYHAPSITTRVRITPADFYQPAHAELWTAFAALHQDGVQPDPATVLARLNLPTHRAKAATELLVELTTAGGMPANADHYADTIRGYAQRRKLDLDLTHLKLRVQDLSLPIEDTVAEAERRIIGGGDMERDVEQLLTLDEFIDAGADERVEWVLPELLARGDRLVITGAEGFGKSVLQRSIAVMTACGLDPFTLRSIPRKKVLVVDCENPKRIMRDKFSDLRTVARTRGRQMEDHLWVQRYPQGLDLAKAPDRLKLHHLCAAVQPDMLVIGPAYKLYVGGNQDREESLARDVTAALDGLRETFGMALILEHHSPHAAPGTAQRTVRPIGSSLWLRWPEFGYGLRPQKGTKPEDRQAEFVPWRGARDERPWPRELVSGPPGGLPWVDPHRMRGAV